MGKGILDEAVSFMVPIRDVEPGHERKILVNNYTRLLGQLKHKAKETKSTWRRAQLTAQAQELTQGLKELIRLEEK